MWSAAAGKDLAAADLVRVTVTEIFAARFVTPALQHLRVHHPEIDVEVLPDHRKLDIGRRQADIALRDRPPEEPGLICLRIARFSFMLYASTEYLKSHPSPERGKGLAHQDLVAWMYILPAPTLQFMNESTDGARIAFRAKIS
jgi:DNA-binding transcriptional LysR family regulator